MTRSGRIYFDHNATAPLRPEARQAMISALEYTGNASSVHGEGRRARVIVETAREAVAALVDAKPEEVVFTSGATEANNWVMRAGWDTIAVSSIEHESVLAPAQASGAMVTELPCGENGAVSDLGCDRTASSKSGAVRADALPHPTLLSLQLANSETGVLQPVAEAVAGSDVVVHTDAAQAVGRIDVSFARLGVALMSISSHKIGGPQGVGALVIRDGLELPAFMLGGGQQRRRRSGTDNVAGIAGFGAAALVAKALLGDMVRVAELRARLEAQVRVITPEVVVIGAGTARLPNTSCLAVPGQDSASLLIKLDLAGIAVSAGSACSSGRIGASPVLAAMGLDETLSRGAIRISLGQASTSGEIDRFLDVWSQIHSGARTRSSVPSRSQSGLLQAAPLARAVSA